VQEPSARVSGSPIPAVPGPAKSRFGVRENPRCPRKRSQHCSTRLPSNPQRCRCPWPRASRDAIA